MSYLQNIVRFTGDINLGGIIDLLICRKADLVSIPDPVNGVIAGEPVLQAGKNFVQWRVTPGTTKARSNSKLSREGSARSNSIDFIIPKDRADLQLMFNQASDGEEFIVIYRYPSSTWKMFGLLDSPVLFEYDHDSGSDFADRNEYNCRFFYEGPDNRFFYDAAAPPSSSSGPSPAIVSVNGVVVASLAPGETINFTTDFSFDFQIIGT